MANVVYRKLANPGLESDVKIDRGLTGSAVPMVDEAPQTLVAAVRKSSTSFWWRYIKKMLSGPVLTDHVRNFTIPAPATIDTHSVTAGYKDVRSDLSETKWAIFKYVDNVITLTSSGGCFDAFKSQFSDSERSYGYVRIQTGDEMSKRTKFVLVTWVGRQVGVMDRAKVTNDKALVKGIITNFAIEFQLENQIDLDEELFRAELFKIGGTNYGTGATSQI